MASALVSKKVFGVGSTPVAPISFACKNLKLLRLTFGKYNFEQKFTYWFLFFGIGIMVVSGFVLWFPAFFTRILPGGIIPAAKLAHSTEAIVAAIFVLIWHFYHVHAERLNLSIFTGRLNEQDMRAFHTSEFERLTGEPGEDTGGRAGK